MLPNDFSKVLEYWEKNIFSAYAMILQKQHKISRVTNDRFYYLSQSVRQYN